MEASILILIAILVILAGGGIALILDNKLEVAVCWVVAWFITYLGFLGMVIF